jgi:hypothetical protein
MNGQYSFASAYECQFLGATTSLPANHIWKAHTEPKISFFAWLVSHDRVLTTHNMIKRNWSYNAICLFCLCFHETTDHLLIKCNFSEALWNLVAYRFQLKDYNYMVQQGDPIQWMMEIIRDGSTRDRSRRLGVLFIGEFLNMKIDHQLRSHRRLWMISTCSEWMSAHCCLLCLAFLCFFSL